MHQNVAEEECVEILAALHVDDLSHTIIAPSGLAIRKSALRVARELEKQMASKGLTISTKSAPVASTPELKRELDTDFRRSALPIRIRDSCEDLGVETAAGKEEPKQEGKQRA